MPTSQFFDQIRKFNDLYKLPNNELPTLLDADRIKNFQNILSEEIDEGSDIFQHYQEFLAKDGGELSPASKAEILTEMADWLGDIVVYCTSEARRWGLPMGKILDVIMASNFSKLGADGLPIYDERGKVMKGPNYWKPEPKLKEMLTKE